MMRIGVVGIVDGWSSQRLADAFEKKTGFRCLIDMERVVLDLESGRAWFGDVEISALDAIVVRKIGAPYSPDLLDRLAMLRYINGRGVPIFSHPFQIKRVLDRLSCTVSLRLADIPMPPTTITEDIDRAVEVLEQYGEAVFKPLYTSKARGMKVIQAGPEARTKIQAFHDAGNEVLYIQKKLELPGHDLGLSFLDGKFIGCYARKSDGNAWHTTTRSGGKYAPYEPSPELIALAERAQAPFGLDFTGVDIAETADGPVVFEVSAFGGFRGLLEANGIDAADLLADYVLGKLKHGQ